MITLLGGVCALFFTTLVKLVKQSLIAEQHPNLFNNLFFMMNLLYVTKTYFQIFISYY